MSVVTAAAFLRMPFIVIAAIYRGLGEAPTIQLVIKWQW